MDVENLNKTYPKYPMTVFDKGWVYGVWYCGTSFQKQKIYGQHPPTYLKRLTALFPNAKMWLHAPSGIISSGLYDDGTYHHTVDLVSRKNGCPEYLADVSHLPFADNTFDIIETDPPYGVEHDKVYGTPKYPRNRARNEFYRVLKPEGYMIWLDVRYPSYSNKEWALKGLICVVTGFERTTRMCSIFQKKI